MTTDLRDSAHPLHAEYEKWRRQEPHLCLNCGKAPPYNGCSALCPKCDRSALARGESTKEER